MKGKYRFRKCADRKFIQVQFAILPNKWISTETDKMTDAVLFAENWLRKNGDKADLTKDEMPSLLDFARDFFKSSDPYGFRKRNEQRGFFYTENYYEQKQALLEHYILPSHGRLKINVITDTMIENLIYSLRSVRTKKALANNTKNKVFDVYTKVMEETRRQGYVQANPCKEVEALANRSKGREAFTNTELAKLFPQNKKELLHIWHGYMWAVYFLIQYETGWRPGEVSALQFSNFFPDTHGIYTASDIDYKKRLQPRIKTTDKGQPYKVGILSDRTCELLIEWQSRCKSDFVFMQKNGKFIGAEGANKHLTSACNRAGIDQYRNGKKRTQYSFRHSFQSYYLGRIPENARLLLMGHTKMRTEYTHIEARELLERVSEIEGLNEQIKRRG